MELSEVRWGIIGAGDVCEVKSGPAMNKIARSKLVAVMRRNGQKARDFAQRHGVPKWYDDADLLIWHHLGLELIDAQFACNRFSCPLIVACAHHNLEAHCMKLTDGLFGCRLDWVRDTQNANCVPVYREPDCGLCFFL